MPRPDTGEGAAQLISRAIDTDPKSTTSATKGYGTMASSDDSYSVSNDNEVLEEGNLHVESEVRRKSISQGVDVSKRQRSFRGSASTIRAAHRFTTNTSHPHFEQAVDDTETLDEAGEEDEPPVIRSIHMSNPSHSLTTNLDSSRPSGPNPQNPSAHNPSLPNTEPSSPTSPRSPKKHTRAISHSRSGPQPHYRWLSNTGSEPGVDVTNESTSAKYAAKFKDTVMVTVVDYSNDGEGTRVDMPGARLERWLDSEDGKRPEPKKKEGGDGEGSAVGLKVEEKPRSGRGKSYRGKAPTQPLDTFKSVRWINIDGMNFEIVKLLALKYKLHPLAIEDALRAANNPRSKLDFYAEHLYAQILVQYTRAEDEEEIAEAANLAPTESSTALFGSHANYIGSSSSITSSSAEQGGVGGSASKRKKRKSLTGLFGVGGGTGKEFTSLPEGVEGVFEPMSATVGHGAMPIRNAHKATVDFLSAKYMIPIRRSVISCFMLRDGTLITMSASPYSGVLDPIYMRLESPEGLLRRTGDSSMLLEALLDVVVDIAIEINQAFEAEILKIEASCLVKPQMESVRHLHIISSQLTRIKRTLAPLSHVLYTMRDQDNQRALASLLYGGGPGTGSGAPAGIGGVGGHEGLGAGAEHHGASAGPMGRGGNGMQERSGGFGMGFGWNAEKSAGYITRVTKVYLSDVIDHLDTVLSNLDQYLVATEHLTDYIFNMMTFESNASMERLSLVTVIFLPLTFMAGYYGMNFTKFPSLENPDAYFWKITAPLVAGFFIIFCFDYIRNAFLTLGRILGRRKREEMMEKEFARRRIKNQ